MPETITIDQPRDADELASTTVTLTGTALPRTWIDVYDWMDFAGQTQVNDEGRWTITLTDVIAGDHIFVARPGKGRDDTMSVSVSCTITPSEADREGRSGLLGRIFRRKSAHPETQGEDVAREATHAHAGDTGGALRPPGADTDIAGPTPAREDVELAVPDEAPPAPVPEPTVPAARPPAPQQEPSAPREPVELAGPEEPPTILGPAAPPLLETVAAQDTRGRPITLRLPGVRPDTFQVEHAGGVMELELSHVPALASLLRTVGWAAIHSPEQNATQVSGASIWVQTTVESGLTACEIRSQSGGRDQIVALPLFAVPSFIRALETLRVTADSRP